MAAATLSAQLRRRVTVVVAILALMFSVGTIVSARAILHEQLDARLDNAFILQQRRRPYNANGGNAHSYSIHIPGMPPGTIIVSDYADGTVSASRIGDGEIAEVSADAVAALESVAADGQKHTIDVPGLGQYRAYAQQAAHPDGVQSIVLALPLADLNTTTLRLTLLAAGLGIIAAVAASVATRAVSDRATRPLRALTSTASAVSQLNLGRGEVMVPAAVPPPYQASTEVAQLTDSFNRMLGNVKGALGARQASETKLRRFVADASHELRNPLAAIRGYSELAARANEQDAAFALGRIDAESRRMTKLVEDLLLLARLDADAPVEMGSVDIVAAVLNAVSDARAAGADHTWQLNLPAEGFEVRANADRLHQVIVNLLANARTHTPPGTTVTTTVGIRDGMACLVVADDGPGIPEEVLPNVFERFSRADKARAHSEAKSTGLGLSIVDAVVSSFGGRAEVSSQPGATAFTVWLPLA